VYLGFFFLTPLVLPALGCSVWLGDCEAAERCKCLGAFDIFMAVDASADGDRPLLAARCEGVDMCD
jgi:hypothetical protein